MKYCFFILFFIIISCNNHQQKVSSTDTLIPALTSSGLKGSAAKNNDEICWAGTLNNKTPVFLHYKPDSNLVIGEIIYLNTRGKLPITLLGTIEDDKSCRLLEFEKSGNITGIITGTPAGDTFNGSWFSPKTGKELVLNLVKKDTVVSTVAADAKLQDISGHYHYQYSEAGPQGDFKITRLPDSYASFGITCVTEEPGRNVAQIDDDTIKLNSAQFIYKKPDTDDCEFRVKFYKGFVYIEYTKGFCDGQFGLNATIDGIFLKTD